MKRKTLIRDREEQVTQIEPLLEEELVLNGFFDGYKLSPRQRIIFETVVKEALDSGAIYLNFRQICHKTGLRKTQLSQFLLALKTSGLLLRPCHRRYLLSKELIEKLRSECIISEVLHGKWEKHLKFEELFDKFKYSQKVSPWRQPGEVLNNRDRTVVKSLIENNLYFFNKKKAVEKLSLGPGTVPQILFLLVDAKVFYTPTKNRYLWSERLIKELLNNELIPLELGNRALKSLQLERILHSFKYQERRHPSHSLINMDIETLICLLEEKLIVFGYEELIEVLMSRGNMSRKKAGEKVKNCSSSLVDAGTLYRPIKSRYLYSAELVNQLRAGGLINEEFYHRWLEQFTREKNYGELERTLAISLEKRHRRILDVLSERGLEEFVIEDIENELPHSSYAAEQYLWELMKMELLGRKKKRYFLKAKEILFGKTLRETRKEALLEEILLKTLKSKETPIQFADHMRLTWRRVDDKFAEVLASHYTDERIYDFKGEEINAKMHSWVQEWMNIRWNEEAAIHCLREGLFASEYQKLQLRTRFTGPYDPEANRYVARCRELLEFSRTFELERPIKKEETSIEAQKKADEKKRLMVKLKVFHTRMIKAYNEGNWSGVVARADKIMKLELRAGIKEYTEEANLYTKQAKEKSEENTIIENKTAKSRGLFYCLIIKNIN